ncbi:MAG TPA: DNA methyltransferase [Spirochaetaceae bacterium]|nr:DNA methyltransferase [Spirochaetaceae bacterium]
MSTPSTMAVVDCVRAIPPGRVASYGSIAAMSGNPSGASGARQVARILHSMSRTHNLPWWRVVKKDGSIALSEEGGLDLQRQLLEEEGVAFMEGGRVDMEEFGFY